MGGYVYGASDPSRRPKPSIAAAAEPEPRSMLAPMRCSCGAVFDLAAARVTARYSDCTMFVTPCCKREADDRVGSTHPVAVRLKDDDPALGRRRAAPDRSDASRAQRRGPGRA